MNFFNPDDVEECQPERVFSRLTIFGADETMRAESSRRSAASVTKIL